MEDRLSGEWKNTSEAKNKTFICGHCGKNVGPSKMYYNEWFGKTVNVLANIYICPSCNKPSYIHVNTGEQIPGPIVGASIEHLPTDVEQLYNEARKCLTVNAFTSTVLACRKLLMNVSVSKGADGGKQFAFYVTYLEDNHYMPPGSRDWVDHIRKKGNEATHEIPSINKDDAIELIEFTEMLLRFVYEMPGRMMMKRNITE